MAENLVEEDIRHDGYVIISEDWALLGGETIFLGHLPGFKVQKGGWFPQDDIPADLAIGVKRLYNKEFDSFKLYQPVVYSDNYARRSLLITRDKRDVKLTKSQIKDRLFQALDKALAEFTDKLTGQDFKERNCHNLHHQFHHGCPKCQFKFKVCGQDLSDFGYAFQRHVSSVFGGGYQCCLMVWKDLRGLIERSSVLDWMELQLGCSQEVVLHVTKQFEQEDVCLLWNTANLERAFHEGMFPRHMDVVNTVFLGKHARFDFDMSKTPVYEQWIKSSPDECVHVPYIQFNNNVFVYGDYGDYNSRNRPRVSRTFANPLGGYEDENPKKTLLGWVENVRKARDRVASLGMNRPQCTVIMNLCCASLGNRMGEEVAEEVVKKFRDKLNLDLDNGSKFSSFLSAFPHDQLVSQIDSTIIPAANKLESLIKELIPSPTRVNMAQRASVPRPNAAEVSHAVACEVIINFGMWGIPNLHKTKAHEKKWAIALGLNNPSVFKLLDVFSGLDVCKNISIKEEDGRSVIEYSGPIILEKDTLKLVHRSPN